ncbi:thiamine diphosphokinase [Pseudooceanicola algae]|nr:thiamine diphosphokinase [Pseudooceanicola algae]
MTDQSAPLPVIRSTRPVALFGGGEIPGQLAETVLAMAGAVVGADGGGEWLLERGRLPDAVIGDMDSLRSERVQDIPPERFIRITEQESTDFEKCLTRIEAPLVLGIGFMGGRVDHMLAAFSVLLRHPDRPCLLVGSEDLVFHAPPDVTLTLPCDQPLSLFPLAPVRGQSSGLTWPIEGLDFAPGGRIGTSNKVVGRNEAGAAQAAEGSVAVSLAFDGPGMLVIMPVAAMADVATALLSRPARWPARAG